MKFALEIVAAGQFPDVAKPLKGFDAGVYEIAIPYRIDAYRTVYALKLDEDVWVVHAFQKKSTQGVKTPQREIDLIHTRIARIRSMLS
ncbi:type II toxin-antitoxin system RelE/ParE family toxin [Terrarubrum flagellatum]|uniref:type II toxin-antitoxin system RelE/ParE family toxin n=1 Tax=Terrirubrum flagellatum TaxID=2895980 RepID=UPI0031450DA7